MAEKKKAARTTKSQAKKILITGGTGFLGTWLVRQFLDAGEKNLRVMASRVPEWMRDAGVEAAEGSVKDAAAVAEAVKNAEVVFHLAGKVSREEKDAISMNEIHVQGTRILCEAAKEAGAKTLILASSSGAIAVSEEPEMFDETYPPRLDLITKFAYYASKFYQEKTAFENFDGKGLKLVVLNPSLLLGAGDERLSSTQPVLDFLARKIPFTPGGGLNFVDARDAAAAFLNAPTLGRHREKYLLGAANMTFADFFGRLERLSGVSAPLLRVPKMVSTAGASLIDTFFRSWNKPSPIQPKEVEMAELFWYFSSAKAEDELNFSPRDSQETLQDTISYLRENFLGEGVFS